MKQSTHHHALLTEFKTLIRLALPIVVAQFAQTANGVVDTLMAGQLGPRDLAAVAVGSSVWVPVFLFLVGVMQGVTPFVARHHGAGNEPAVGGVVQQGIWMAIPLGLLGFLLLRSVEPVLALMDVQPELRPSIIGYLEGVSWGMPAITLFLSLRCLTEGMSFTRPVMVISLIGLTTNIPLNYIFMYGKFGLPAMGGVGCGWATGIIMWLMLILMLTHCLLTSSYRNTAWNRHFQGPHPAKMLPLLKLGLPIGGAIFIEVSLFCVIALFIASISTDVVAGHQIALNVASLVFMIPLSLALALTVRVGFNLGRGHLPGVLHARQSGMALIVVVALMNSTLMVLFREPIARLYTDDMDVIALATSLLIFAAVFQLSDGLQVGANGVLRGLQDTTVPMLLTVVAYWLLGLPIGYALGMTNWLMPVPLGAQGFWVGLVAGLTAAAILLNLRVRLRLRALSQHPPGSTVS